MQAWPTRSAVALLEPLAAGPELALAYRTRALVCLDKRDTAAAIGWAQRAITLADRCGDEAGWLVDQLSSLRHPDGTPLVRIYGPTDVVARGGTVAFNVLSADGRPVDYRVVEAVANRWLISLRSGCFCNPGASEAALGLTLHPVRAQFCRWLAAPGPPRPGARMNGA